jgi:hypothetical protein
MVHMIAMHQRQEVQKVGGIAMIPPWFTCPAGIWKQKYVDVVNFHLEVYIMFVPQSPQRT